MSGFKGRIMNWEVCADRRGASGDHWLCGEREREREEKVSASRNRKRSKGRRRIKETTGQSDDSPFLVSSPPCLLPLAGGGGGGGQKEWKGWKKNEEKTGSLKRKIKKIKEMADPFFFAFIIPASTLSRRWWIRRRKVSPLGRPFRRK